MVRHGLKYTQRFIRPFSPCMLVLRRLQRQLATMAIAILLAGIVTPALAYGAQGPGLPSFMPVCSLDGSYWVKIDNSDANSQASHSGLEHCPACFSPSGAALPPVNLTPPLGAISSATLVPERFLSAPRTAVVWLTASPRAPPLQS